MEVNEEPAAATEFGTRVDEIAEEADDEDDDKEEDVFRRVDAEDGRANAPAESKTP